MTDRWSFAGDVQAIVDGVGPDWERLRGARIFMTGGTGFIGRWMLETLRRADQQHALDVTVTVLSRDPRRFADAQPHLAAHPGFTFVTGVVVTLPAGGARYSHVIHAATDASAELNQRDPRRMFDTVVEGTRRALDFALATGAERVFFLSSGAVYGSQPPDMPHVAEDWHGGPDPLDPRNAYAEGKRAAEMLCAIYGRQFGLDVVDARIFAVLGPLLKLDIHFAAGNFILDAIAGRRIVVKSAGTPERSYIYATDLIVWLWAIFLRGTAGTAYNVGSEEAISIAALAKRTALVLGGAGVDILGQPDPGWNLGRYVPSTARIRRELGVSMTVDLDEAIRRTALANGWTQ